MADGRAVPDVRDLECRWAAIRGRMEAASEVLARRGSIASRLTSAGTRVYSVRYPDAGAGRQRSIYIGLEGLLVRRARVLLAEYREREQQVREAEAAARFAAASGALLRRLAASRRGGPRRLGGA